MDCWGLWRLMYMDHYWEHPWIPGPWLSCPTLFKTHSLLSYSWDHKDPSWDYILQQLHVTVGHPYNNNERWQPSAYQQALYSVKYIPKTQEIDDRCPSFQYIRSNRMIYLQTHCRTRHCFLSLRKSQARMYICSPRTHGTQTNKALSTSQANVIEPRKAQSPDAFERLDGPPTEMKRDLSSKQSH